MQYYDLHTHILPKMDDGAKSSEISIEMLSDAAEQGVNVLAATSHYYSDERSVSEYLSAREAAFSRLSEKLANSNVLHPKIILGAEVYLTRGLSQRDDLELLCYEGTRLLLLELPYEVWGSWVYREVERIVSNHALTVVLAHPGRYVFRPWDMKKLAPFEQMGVIYQLNAEDILESRKVCDKLLKSGRPCVLGSDAHNMDRRRSRIKEAVQRLEEMYGGKLLSEMENFICDKWRV